MCDHTPKWSVVWFITFEQNNNREFVTEIVSHVQPKNVADLTKNRVQFDQLFAIAVSNQAKVTLQIWPKKEIQFCENNIADLSKQSRKFDQKECYILNQKNVASVTSPTKHLRRFYGDVTVFSANFLWVADAWV